MLSDHKIIGQENFKLPLVLLAGSLITMAGGVLAPILPDLSQQLALNPVLVGNLVSIHCLTLALFCLPLGIITDQFSPSKVLIPSLALYSIFGCAGALMTDFWPLLATRALLGAASGGIAAASLGWLGQEYEGEERSQAIGYATATLTIAGIICPLLGGWLGSWNWRWAFCLYGVGLPLAFLTNWVIAPSEPHTHNKAHSVPDLSGTFLKLLRHRSFWRLMIGLTMASLVMYAVFIYLPLYLKEASNTTPTLNGLILACESLGAALISAFGVQPLAQKIGRDHSIALGFTIMAGTLAIVPLFQDYVALLAVAILFGIGLGLVIPNIYNALANLAPQKLQGSVLATGTGASFFGQFLSPIVLGPVLGIGDITWVFYTAAAVALTGGCILFYDS